MALRHRSMRAWRWRVMLTRCLPLSAHQPARLQAVSALRSLLLHAQLRCSMPFSNTAPALAAHRTQNVVFNAVRCPLALAKSQSDVHMRQHACMWVQAPVGGYATQRWPEDVGDPPRQAGAPAPGGDAAPAAAQGAAGSDWRAQVGGLQAGVDAQLRRTLADALLLLEPVR